MVEVSYEPQFESEANGERKLDREVQEGSENHPQGWAVDADYWGEDDDADDDAEVVGNWGNGGEQEAMV